MPALIDAPLIKALFQSAPGREAGRCTIRQALQAHAEVSIRARP